MSLNRILVPPLVVNEFRQEDRCLGEDRTRAGERDGGTSQNWKIWWDSKLQPVPLKDTGDGQPGFEFWHHH